MIQPQAFFGPALGTSWDRHVGHISLVRLPKLFASGPRQLGLPHCAVCGQPVGVRSPGNYLKV